MDKKEEPESFAMGEKRIQVTLYTCERCGHDWIARRRGERPRVCAKCKSAYWDVPRKNKAQPPTSYLGKPQSFGK